MAHIECWFGSFVIFRGSGPGILRNPIKFVIFQGRWSGSLSAPLDPHMALVTKILGNLCNCSD